MSIVRNASPPVDALAQLAAPALLASRALMAYLFVSEGYGKIFSYAAVAEYMRGYGVPSALLPLVILAELGGGLLILIGAATRPAALALAAFAVLTALIFHANGAGAEQTINFQKNFAIAGGFLALVVSGPGAWSVDCWLSRRRKLWAP